MKKLLSAALVALCLAGPAFAQPASYYHIDPVSGAKVAVTVDDGAHPMPTSASIVGGGDASAAKQDTQITAANLTNTDLGPLGATACATDNGSCSINALVQRVNQRLTSMITTLGTPLQAGGNVVVTSSALPTGAATAAKQASLDTAGAVIVPKAGTADRVVTKTSVSANTSTSVCPTATAPVTTEIWVETGAVGISLAGGTLTQATWGTTASTKPDLVIASTAPYFLLPVASTNAITAYTATAQGVTCVQTIRQ